MGRDTEAEAVRGRRRSAQWGAAGLRLLAGPLDLLAGPLDLFHVRVRVDACGSLRPTCRRLDEGWRRRRRRRTQRSGFILAIAARRATRVATSGVGAVGCRSALNDSRFRECRNTLTVLRVRSRGHCGCELSSVLAAYIDRTLLY